MRPTRPAPRSTWRSILRATAFTAIAFAGAAALLLATRDDAATTAHGTTLPPSGSTPAAPASTPPPGPGAPVSSPPATTAKKRSTTTTSAAAPATTKPRSSATTAAPAAPTPTTPEGFARGLYAAWAEGSRSTAATVASPGAIAALFGSAPAPVRPYRFSGCTGAAGSELCRFESGDGHALLMKVRTGTGGLPMTVTEVTFPPAGG